MPQIRALKTRGMGTIYSSDQFVGLVSKRISSLHPAEPSVILFALFVQSDVLSHCMLYVWVGQSSPLKPSCKTVLLQARAYFKKSSKSLKLFEAESNVHVHRWSDVIVIVLAKWRNAMMSQYITYLFVFLSLSLYLMPLQKCLFWEEKKTIPLVGVSQPYVSRANLLRHSKRHEGCGTILRGWSTNWDVRWFDSFFF